MLRSFGHQTGGEAVVGGVGAADHFFLVVEGQQAHHRAEDFFTHDRHVVAAVGEDRRLDESALVEGRALDTVAAGQQPGALLAAHCYVAQHLFHVREAGERAEIGVPGSRVAEADALQPAPAAGLPRPAFTERWTKTRVPLVQT